MTDRFTKEDAEAFECLLAWAVLLHNVRVVVMRGE